VLSRHFGSPLPKNTQIRKPRVTYPDHDAHTQVRTSILRSSVPSKPDLQRRGEGEKREETAKAKPTAKFCFLCRAQATLTSDCRRIIPEDLSNIATAIRKTGYLGAAYPKLSGGPRDSSPGCADTRYPGTAYRVKTPGGPRDEDCLHTRTCRHELHWSYLLEDDIGGPGD